MPCDRFEREALRRLEKNLPLDPHFDDCPDCRAAREAYDGLRQALSTLGADDRPPAGWQAQVRQRIEQRRRARRRPRWIPLAAAFAGAAAALLIVVTATRDGSPPESPTLTVRIGESAGTVLRGSEAQAGDSLLLTATVSAELHAELRVYRDDRELILSCSSEPPCDRDGQRLSAQLTLPAAGSYQSVLFTSQAVLQPSQGTLDEDAGRALKEGADVKLGSEVIVR